MVIAVTGATGFLGGALARELVQRGEKVRALVRKAANVKQLEALNIEIFYGDLQDETSLDVFLEGCDCLHHMAGMVDLSVRDQGPFYRVNVAGTANLLQAALKKRVKRVVYCSSAATLCPMPGGVLTEEPPTERQSMGPYSDSKSLAEQEALKFLERGLSIILINPTNVFGPGSITNINRTVLDVLRGKLPGVPDARTNLVFVDDVVQGHILGYEKGVEGRRYLIAGENIKMADAYQIALDTAGIKRKVRSIPMPMIKLYAYMGDIMSWFTKKPPLISRNELGPINSGVTADGSRTRQELGYTMTSIHEGMEKLVAWFLQDNHLSEIVYKA